jgi:Holliday junction resolvase
VTRYSDGYRFECGTRDLLREKKYEVIRSAGSKGKIDIVGIRAGELLFIQCKLQGLCPPAERKRVLELSRMVNAVPLIAYSHKEGRAAATVRFFRLLGTGPYEREDWVIPDR